MTTVDERLADVGRMRRLLIRPELGSLVGAIVVLLFFSVQSSVFRSLDGIANWLDPAATIGIMAVPVALLMIGGEFDLSAGVMTGSTGLVTAILATEYGWNVWPALAMSLLLALIIGLFNGFLVVRTGLPSFIVTLGSYLMLQGLNLGVTKALTDQVQVGGMVPAGGFRSAHLIFASSVVINGTHFKISIVWWLGITAVASYLLLRTRAGNWIFAVGGDAGAARNVGVAAARTKVLLFVGTAVGAWLVGNITLLQLTSVQAGQGLGNELIYIVAAVIGGCLLTGGFGSAVGASLGALIFGAAEQGIVYLNWDADWFKFFLGAMLLLAVLANRLVRSYAEQSGKQR